MVYSIYIDIEKAQSTNGEWTCAVQDDRVEIE